MQLNFPNPSRSYDEKGNGVLFWGYDRTFEVRFLVEDAALAMFAPEGGTGEAAALGVFDDNIDRIHEVAGTVYNRRRKSPPVYGFTLTRADF